MPVSNLQNVVTRGPYCVGDPQAVGLSISPKLKRGPEGPSATDVSSDLNDSAQNDQFAQFAHFLPQKTGDARDRPRELTEDHSNDT